MPTDAKVAQYWWATRVDAHGVLLATPHVPCPLCPGGGGLCTCMLLKRATKVTLRYHKNNPTPFPCHPPCPFQLPPFPCHPPCPFQLPPFPCVPSNSHPSMSSFICRESPYTSPTQKAHHNLLFISYLELRFGSKKDWISIKPRKLSIFCHYFWNRS